MWQWWWWEFKLIQQMKVNTWLLMDEVNQCIFHRSAGANAKGSGGRNHCGHLQEHGGSGLQPPPSWNRLRQTVRGWVLVVTSGRTSCTLNVVVNQVLKTLSPRTSNTWTINWEHSQSSGWLLLIMLSKQNGVIPKQLCLACFEILTEAGRFSGGQCWSPTGSFVEWRESVWDPLTENNNQTYEFSSGTSSLIQLILEATSLRKQRSLKITERLDLIIQTNDYPKIQAGLQHEYKQSLPHILQ